MSDDRQYPERPYVGVGAVILKGDQVLLVRRGKAPRLGAWSIPGGMQHLGETVAEAAHREIHEETGLEVEILGIVDVVDSIQRDGDGRILYHYTLVDVAAAWRAGEARAGDDAAAVEWVARSAREPYRLWSETERIIAAAAKLRDRAAA